MVFLLPPFSTPQALLCGHENGQWKVPGPGSPGEDNHGDGQMIRDLTTDPPIYRMAFRIGGGNGGVYVEREDTGPGAAFDWTGVTLLGGNQSPIQSIGTADPTNEGNIDTFSLAVNPYTGVVTIVNGVKPGNIPEIYSGYWSGVQRRTSNAPHKGGAFLGNPDNWNSFGAEFVAEVVGEYDPEWTGPTWHEPRLDGPLLFSGGLGEPTIFYEPFLDKMIVTYEAKSSGPSQWNKTDKNRIGMRQSVMTDFDTAPTWIDVPILANDSAIFDPETLAEYIPSPSEVNGPWGTKPGITQRCGIAVNPIDGVWWMAFIGQIAAMQAGVANASTGIGLAYSENQGATWALHPDNPIFDKEILGWGENPEVNWVNSPYLIFEPDRSRCLLGFWGNPIGEQNKKGTRFWLAQSSFPTDYRFHGRSY